MFVGVDKYKNTPSFLGLFWVKMMKWGNFGYFCENEYKTDNLIKMAVLLVF